MKTGRIENDTQDRSGRLARIGHILRIIIYVLAALTVFFYFFSFIGIVVGIGFILFSRNREWKAHGAVLVFAVAFSTWFSNSGIEMAQLKLTAIAGPSILFV